MPSDRTKPLLPGDHRATIRGATLRYVVRGNGPPLILHPGGAGWGGDLSPYLESCQPLERARTVIYLEPRGLGLSDRTPAPGGYSIAEYAADLEAFREHLELDRFDLLGHSHGGFVAQSYAAAFPVRVQRLILVGTTPTLALGDRPAWLASRPGSAEAARAAEAAAGRLDLSADEKLRATLLAMVPVLHFHDYRAVASKVTPLIERMTVSAQPFGAFLGGEAATFDLRDRLDRITAPTLVVVGDDEMPEMVEGSKFLAERIPKARLVQLTRSGHWPMLESPLQFAAAVNDFLGETTPV